MFVVSLHVCVYVCVVFECITISQPTSMNGAANQKAIAQIICGLVLECGKTSLCPRHIYACVKEGQSLHRENIERLRF